MVDSEPSTPSGDRAVTYRRLDPQASDDMALCQQVFRRAPSFVYPTGGRPATDEDVVEMFTRLPPGFPADRTHVYAIEDRGMSCGFYLVLQGYPDADTAYVALLLLAEATQGRGLGTQALKRIEEEARAWGCTALAAAVDSKNEFALRFWMKRAFAEEFRKPSAGFLGDAVGIRKQLAFQGARR